MSTAILYCILFFSVIVGGGLVIILENKQTQSVKLMLAFSGAFLLTISILHFFPHLYSSDHNHDLGIYILAGFFLQIFLEFFSGGMEHGHAHLHGHQKNRIPIAVMAGLCIHALLEGMPLADQSENNANNALLFGILFHRVPVAFVFASTLKELDMKPLKFWITLTGFAAMSPLGVLMSHYIEDMGMMDTELYFDRVLAVVLGIFLHISTTIIFESSEGHRFNKHKLLAIVVGTFIAWLSASHG